MYVAILRSKQGGSVLQRVGKNLLKHNFCSFVIDSKNQISDTLSRNAWSADYEVTKKDFNIDKLDDFTSGSRDMVCYFFCLYVF